MMSNNTNYDQQNTLRVLVDMDGVVADFDLHLEQEFRKHYPNDKFCPLKNRRDIKACRDYEKYGSGLGEKVRHIARRPGFFLSMEEIDGAVSAVKEMSGLSGVKVFICSTPQRNSEHCAQEKRKWVEEHFGPEWAAELILTDDKTSETADLLIDDNPSIKGSMKPKWVHVLFKQCHNHEAYANANHRLKNWTDDSWKHLIAKYKREFFIK